MPDDKSLLELPPNRLVVNKPTRSFWRAVSYCLLLLATVEIGYFLYNGAFYFASPNPLILSLAEYGDTSLDSTWEQLWYRIQRQPFNLLSLIIFLCAITHTFFAHKFMEKSNQLKAAQKDLENPSSFENFKIEILHFLGEVEIVFGVWVIPLILCMGYLYNWKTAIHYLNGISYIEPLFVVVIMAITSTKPIIYLAEKGLKWVARVGGESVKSWWWVLLTIGPLTGSFITEPGAMTICALLLAKQFYHLKPTPLLAYATLGLLFTNISVGGVLTNFAAPPVLMVSKVWDWSSQNMLMQFGWKAVCGILIANFLYYQLFRKEFSQLEIKRQQLKISQKDESQSIPAWICLAHIFFLAWMVLHAHYPVVFIGTFLLFIGFYRATLPFQWELELKTPILVGFFLAGLVIHGTLQAWWISPLLGHASKEILLGLSILLTAFNDNAEITFLATLIPTFTEPMKYAVLAGSVTGGGLTVIANAPNPLGQAILAPYFADGISTLYLFLGALIPTLIMGSMFYFF
ncbi:hypothetical protein PARA125_000489 [Parachlamydia sp. AcF125]|nr:hypothetical protein [Parachlamydia sp. AcF125]